MFRAWPDRGPPDQRQVHSFTQCSVVGALMPHGGLMAQLRYIIQVGAEHKVKSCSMRKGTTDEVYLDILAEEGDPTIARTSPLGRPNTTWAIPSTPARCSAAFRAEA